MITPEQRAAINRRNSLKSTGPKTSAGKQRSAMNACRHGLTGHIVVMPAGDFEAYRKFQDSFHQHHQPAGPVEVRCVQFMVDACWKINRASAWQDQILCQQSVHHDSDTGGCENNGPVNTAFAIAAVVAGYTRELANLSLYEQRNYRLFERAGDQLAILQSTRKQREEPVPRYRPAPYNSTADGFVCSPAASKAHSSRSERVHQALRVPRTHSAAACGESENYVV